MKINIKKLTDTARTPLRGTPESAGYDLYANIEKEFYIMPGETQIVSTGLSMDLPSGYAAFIFARSSLAIKKGLRPANCVGVCDADYRGEYKVALYNDSNLPQLITPQERIGQVIFLKFEEADFEEVEELSDTVRGEGGFGSTGTH